MVTSCDTAKIGNFSLSYTSFTLAPPVRPTQNMHNAVAEGYSRSCFQKQRRAIRCDNGAIKKVYFNFVRMKHLILVVVLFRVAVCYGQTSFNHSEALFEKYLMTDSSRAKVQLEYQRKHARSQKDKTRYGLNQAAYYYHNNRFKLAEACLAKLSGKVRGDVELEGEFVRIRSLIRFKQTRFKESNELIADFFSRHKKVPVELRLNLQMNSCENDIAMGNYSQAHKRALIGYGIFRKKPSGLSDELKIRTLSTLYNICHYEAKYDSALYYLYQAEPFMKDGTIAKAGFYGRIAIIYTMTEQHPKAIAYYGKSIAILEKSNAPILLAHDLYNLGVSTKAMDPDKSGPIFEKALKIAREANYEQITGYALQELGDLSLMQKDYVRADKYNREALEILRNAGIDRGVVHVLLNLGRQHYETGHFSEALKYLEEALAMTKESEDMATLEYCYEYLCNSYERMGDYRMAYHYHKLFAETQRSILKLDLQSNIEKLNLSYDVRVEQATNKLLKKEVQLKNKKLSAEQTTKWLLGILLAVLLVAGWFLRRLLIQRARLKEFELQLVHSELEGVEKEKDRTVQELDAVKQQMISKNVLIGELNKLLLENEQTVFSKEQFGTLVTNDTDWVQFLAKLQLLFPLFSDNLKSRHPNLSNTEFRLAALVRLNLSDKEISELLIIELSSVKKAKNRLKQKLGLDAGEKLDLYLGQL